MIGQGLAGGRAEAALASQLKEKESQLAALLKDREGNSTTMCQEVSELTTALQECQTMVQVRYQNWKDGHILLNIADKTIKYLFNNFE